jgi:hypothetical protein
MSQRVQKEGLMPNLIKKLRDERVSLKSGGIRHGQPAEQAKA